MAHTEKNLLGHDTFFDVAKMPTGPSEVIYDQSLNSHSFVSNKRGERGMKMFILINGTFI